MRKLVIENKVKFETGFLIPDELLIFLDLNKY